jgi:uncharacterized SAM-binding protein YcdF (DUF218 family)
MNNAKAENKRAQAHVAVVLGSYVLPDGKPGGALLRRIEKAVALFRKKEVEYILATGGVGINPVSEAESMRDFALENGVPEDRIFLEKKAANTLDNARLAAEIIEKEGWTRVLLVTDGYHMLRAALLFRVFGIRVVPCGVETPERRKVPKVFAFYCLREFLALVHNVLKLGVMALSGNLWPDRGLKRP